MVRSLPRPRAGGGGLWPSSEARPTNGREDLGLRRMGPAAVFSSARREVVRAGLQQEFMDAASQVPASNNFALFKKGEADRLEREAERDGAQRLRELRDGRPSGRAARSRNACSPGSKFAGACVGAPGGRRRAAGPRGAEELCGPQARGRRRACFVHDAHDRASLGRASLGPASQLGVHD